MLGYDLWSEDINSKQKILVLEYRKRDGSARKRWNTKLKERIQLPGLTLFLNVQYQGYHGNT